MPVAYTRATNDMTGLAVTACKQAMIGPVGSGINPDRTLLSFQRPLRTWEGTPPANGRRIRRDQPLYLPEGDLASPATRTAEGI